MKVLGMGNALVDVLIRVNDEKLLEQLKLPKGSMQLVDEVRMAEIMEATSGLPVTMISGGSAANTIHGLAELGVATGFIGSAGRDQWGEFYINDLKSKHIDPVFYRPEKPTGLANALLTPDGERTFGTFLGAAIELGPDFLTQEMFAGWTVFYIEGYLMQNHALIHRALELAKEAGCMVALDFASYNVVEENLEFLKSVLPEYVDIVFANQEEALAFTGKGPEEAVDELAALCRLAVVKTGKDGAWVKTAGEKHAIPGLRVNCVDTTGAGDLFASGFLFGYLEGFSLEECGKAGNMLASHVIEVLGPKIGADTWTLVKGKLKKA
jgi:sugar/nucleoside kinase (ribokinase family)